MKPTIGDIKHSKESEDTIIAAATSTAALPLTATQKPPNKQSPNRSLDFGMFTVLSLLKGMRLFGSARSQSSQSQAASAQSQTSFVGSYGCYLCYPLCPGCLRHRFGGSGGSGGTLTPNN